MLKKRLIILFLILSTLSYSSVWAMHNHEDGVGHQKLVTSHVINLQEADSNHHLDDDHCCHASVHLLGLFISNFDIEPITIPQVEAQYSFFLFSYHNRPPQRPPLI